MVARYAAGATEAQVARALGIPPQRQRRVWRLHDLVPELRAALHGRKMTQAVAEQAARLPGDDQLDLAASGMITADMVRAKRAVLRAAAVDDMFADLGDETQASEPEAAPAAPAAVTLGLAADAPAWRVAAADGIRRAIAAVPPEECTTRYAGTGKRHPFASPLLSCLMQAAVSLGVDLASGYEILLSPDQLAALRASGRGDPGRPAAERRAS